MLAPAVSDVVAPLVMNGIVSAVYDAQSRLWGSPTVAAISPSSTLRLPVSPGGGRGRTAQAGPCLTCVNWCG